MLIIGEKINGTRPEVRGAVAGRNAAVIHELAKRQVLAGAAVLDLNAGTSPDREPDDLAWLVRTVREAVDVRLCLDSANPDALVAGIAESREPPIINSISGESRRLGEILPLVVEHRCPVIALALDDNGIPKSAEDRMGVIRRLLEGAGRAGVEEERIYVDPLVLAVSTEGTGGMAALDTIRRVRELHPSTHVVVGLSNISFGLPARTFVNQAFLTLAVAAGCDTVIMDPTNRDLQSALLAAEVVLGRDRHCLNYSRAYRTGRIDRAGATDELPLAAPIPDN